MIDNKIKIVGVSHLLIYQNLPLVIAKLPTHGVSARLLLLSAMLPFCNNFSQQYFLTILTIQPASYDEFYPIRKEGQLK